MCTLFTETAKIFQKDDPLEDDEDKSVEDYEHFWPLLLEILENSEQMEVHYATIRFAAALIQSFNKFANGYNCLERLAKGNDDTPYGTLLCWKFCILFKKVYFPKKTERQDFSESFKNDICCCLSILLLYSPDAKQTAIMENLVQKLAEKANDLCCAYRIGAVQDSTTKNDDKDSRFFERECIRLLKILKNTFCKAGEELTSEIVEKVSRDTGFNYNACECPKTIQKLIEVYENVAKETTSPIFTEIAEVLCTLCAQASDIKKCFAMPLTNKKYTGVRVVLKSLRNLNFNSKGPEVKLIFNLAISLCMINENVKKIIKDKTIEDIIPKLLPGKLFILL